ncbi:MAG: hydroxymethylbilane synthase [Candidatus Sumerlaeia bacterium]|nr:hydroxymethylbilane synthase [Candidatus Sumerlaeia bacterium]
MTLRVGTRGSRLALVQARGIVDSLRGAHPGLEVELVVVQTTGDRILDAPLAKIGGKGVFTKEIESALLDRRIDIAVHSLKDVPTLQPPGLDLAAVTIRESPFDVLLAARPMPWGGFPGGTRIGTSSLRRGAMVRAAAPNATVLDLRGNVPTRIDKMMRGEYDAIILAEAGVARLGLDAPYRQVLSPPDLLPAPGQGALGLQIRDDDTRTRELLQVLHDEESAACCTAERALLHALGGGCQMPLGAHGTIDRETGKLKLLGRILSPDGGRVLDGKITGDASDPGAVGSKLASLFLERGAREILAQLHLPSDGFEQAVARSAALDTLPLGGRRVIITRDEDSDGPLSCALRDLGAHPVCLPCVEHRPPADAAPFQSAMKRLDIYTWVVLTSRRAVRAFVEATRESAASTPRVACVGRSTRDAATAAGLKVDLVPGREDAEGLLGELLPRLTPSDRILYPRSSRAGSTLADGLRDAGITLDDPVAYETHPAAPADLLRAFLHQGPPHAITFASPSAVAGFVEAARAIDWNVETAPCFAIGNTTARAMKEHGIPVARIAREHTFPSLAEAVKDELSR